MQAQHWQNYAKLEISTRQLTKAKGIFSRCLLNCFSMPLWTTYIDFIKQVLVQAHSPCMHSQPAAHSCVPSPSSASPRTQLSSRPCNSLRVCSSTPARDRKASRRSARPFHTPWIAWALMPSLGPFGRTTWLF